LTCQDGLNEFRDFVGVILVIRILNNDNIACKVLQASANGRTLTHVYAVSKDRNHVSMFLSLDSLKFFKSTVVGAVIDENNFIQAWVLNGYHSRNYLFDGVFFIENRNKNRQFHSIFLGPAPARSTPAA